MLNQVQIKSILFLAASIFVNSCLAHDDESRLKKINLSYCAEQQGVNSLADAFKCDYSKKPPAASLKFTNTVKWIKIETPKAEKTKDFVIKVEPFLLQKIDLYYQAGSEWIKITTGASQNINLDLVAIAGYRMVVPASDSDLNTYYLAITAPSLSFFSIEVDEWSTVAKEKQNIGFGLQLGILVAILVFAFMSYALNRSIAMGRFFLFATDLLLCTLFGSGFIMQTFLPKHPELNEFLFHSLLCLRIALWVWIMQSLLSFYKMPNWYIKSCSFIYGLVGLEIALYPALGTTPLSSFIVLLYLLAPIFHIFAVNQTEDISKPFKLILNGGFYLTVGLFSLTIVSLMLLIKPNSEMPLYITRLTDFTTPLLMLGIIGYRNRLVHKELDEVKRALNEATIRAEYEKKLLTDRQTLIDMFAHELKNPLTSISLAVDNLADNSEPNASSSRKRIANINRSIKDMDEIIERCNLMNTLDSKSIALEKNQVFLRKFVRQILVSLEAQDIVVVDITPDIELSTDAKFLRVIFTNLIQNALKYSVPNSKITIMARETSPNVSIEFTNELNVSMLPDELLIFTRFYRHPLAHEKRGAGLGLYLTKEMCKLLGGYISYNHENGVVIFSVEIPSL